MESKKTPIRENGLILMLRNYFRHIIDYMQTHWLQLTKFVSIGLATFAVNFLSFHLFYVFFRPDYKIPISLAYIVTVIFHFNLNRIFTFEVSGENITKHAYRYILIVIFNYFFTMAIIWCAVNILRISPYLGLILSTILAAALNFALMKHYVFE